MDWWIIPNALPISLDFKNNKTPFCNLLLMTINDY
jgi:hypothetical protein